jgi:hypothetical protein
LCNRKGETMGIVSRMVLASFLFSGSFVMASEKPIYTEALDRAAIRMNDLSDIVDHGLLLGNGDLNALVHSDGDDLVVRLTKNDVWDARIPTELDPPLPTYAQILKLWEPDGPKRTEGWPNRGFIVPQDMDYEGPDSYSANAYPCPRACGVVRVAGAAKGALAAVLDLRGATLTVTSDAGLTALRIDANTNRMLIQTDFEAPITLHPMASKDLPAPTQGQGPNGAWLTQQIPGDTDWPGMAFTVYCKPDERRALVSVVTSLESKDMLGDALALASTYTDRDFTAHKATWETFWSASGISLSDPLLEQTWYRNLYFLRCVSKPGVQAPGLFAGLIDDKPMWHGDYHTNYNFQQTFWGAYAANHGELAEPYDRLIRNYLPRAQWLCKTVFGWEGAFFPHVLYAYEPTQPEDCKAPNGRQYLHHVWGFTMGVTPFTVQPVWWQYKHYPDRRFLAETAYPLVREAAKFCAGFVENGAARGKDAPVFGPSVSPEHWAGWPEDFTRNYDSTFDIGYFHFIFDAALEGAGELGEDADWAERWRAAKKLLPDYPTTDKTDPVVVDMADAPPIEYNIPVPATPVFPADQITWQSPEGTRKLFTRTIDTLRTNGNNSAVMLSAARARLNMPDTIDFLKRQIQERLRSNGTLSLNALDPPQRFNDFGHYTEMFGVVLPITELLLQSTGDALRVFPAWPKGQPASFHHLRSQGGFLVSANYDGKQVTQLSITSTIGGPLRLLNPWPKAQSLQINSAPINVPTDQILELKTQAGEEIQLTP